MTKKQAVAQFKKEVLPFVSARFERDGKRDVIARREAFNNFTDMLCKAGFITLHQYETWVHPPCCQ